jgi:hypothetical protein
MLSKLDSIITIFPGLGGKTMIANGLGI